MPVGTAAIPTFGERFLQELFLEHLEEVSFLYEQRLSLLDDPELSWTDMHDFEERFEAHIDALVLGEGLALDLCSQRAADGDFGELHAAFRVFCRQHEQDLVHAIIRTSDPEDDERMKAIADALCHELPNAWQHSFEKKVAEGEPIHTRVAVRALAYRRMPVAETLLKALPNVKDESALDFIWALGRLRDARARPLLHNTYLQHDEEELRSAAALALLRIGEPAALHYCAGIARSQAWALLPIGLGGSRSHLKLLMDVAASESVSPECMISLGLLGEASAVDPLLYHLGDERLAEAASIGLYLITGAPLFEEVFIPEAVAEDELFDDEREQMGNGGFDPTSEDEPRGTTLARVSQQPDVWKEWWRDQQAGYERGVRYRNGGPYGPESLLDNLTAEQSPWLVRRLAAEELVIRYGCDLPFETDMFVARQVEALTDVRHWMDSRAGRFTPGRWYVAGRIASA